MRHFRSVRALITVALAVVVAGLAGYVLYLIVGDLIPLWLFVIAAVAFGYGVGKVMGHVFAPWYLTPRRPVAAQWNEDEL